MSRISPISSALRSLTYIPSDFGETFVTLTTSNPAFSLRRIASFSLLVFLSFVLPLAVALWSIHLFRLSSSVLVDYAGSVKDGELWFVRYRFSSEIWSPPCQCRIMRRNIVTGIERDTGLMMVDELVSPMWVGDEMYVIATGTIHQLINGSLQPLARLPPESSNFVTTPFVYNGQLSMIVMSADGQYRMTHFHDGRWIDGRRILLPGSYRVWSDDPQLGRRKLLPLSSEQPVTPYGYGYTSSLTVQQCGETVHLFWSTGNFAAYRCGLEFADDESDEVSALAPENSIREVSGWEAIHPVNGKMLLQWYQMKCDRDGALFTSTDPTTQIIRRKPDGHWETIVGQPDHRSYELPGLVSDSSGEIAYFVWSSGAISRIHGNALVPTHFTVDDGHRTYLRRWQYLAFGLLGAWLIHLAVIIGGTEFMTRGESHAVYQFGIQSVTMASIARRSFALTIDVFLLAMILLLSWRAHLWIIGIQYDPVALSELCFSLTDIEESVLSYNVQFNGFPPPEQVANLISNVFMLVFWGHPKEPAGFIFTMIFIVGIDTVLTLCCLKFFDEGRIGVTPGKWLFGIRTMRSTLRPCGFARSLVRGLFYWLEIPLLVTPLPAAASIVFSQNRQRFGDRVADTLVVNAGSIREGVNSPK